ncbi:hypothetical protein K438DRAFT_2131700 [Mycena galopus ATCC 62051]|nr:hypothetical protein K438DRAFT_2131700 [Mycena galopus ATCC 62051]
MDRIGAVSPSSCPMAMGISTAVYFTVKANLRHWATMNPDECSHSRGKSSRARPKFHHSEENLLKHDGGAPTDEKDLIDDVCWWGKHIWINIQTIAGNAPASHLIQIPKLIYLKLKKEKVAGLAAKKGAKRKDDAEHGGHYALVMFDGNNSLIWGSTLHLPTMIQVNEEDFNADSDGSIPKDVNEHEDLSYAEEDPSGPPNSNGEILSERGGILTGRDLPSESPEIEHDTVELRVIHDHEEMSVPSWTFRFLNMQLVHILFLPLTDVL